MNQDRTFSVTTSPSTPAVDLDINEAHRRVVTPVGPRRLIAAGIKRGNGQLVVTHQTPEVRRAVALFRSAALTVAQYEAVDSADMTPDEHNTWYDKLNVMREARAVLEAAGQSHLVEAVAA
jgi:hypothetical protein